MTSGAIQKGVPTNVCRLLVVLVNWPATPKSASFTSPSSESSTLAAVGGGNQTRYTRQRWGTELGREVDMPQEEKGEMLHGKMCTTVETRDKRTDD